MSTQSLDPQSALVALRIAELRREARGAALARRVRTRTWPQAVVAGLRDTFLRATARNASARTTAACATC